MDLLSPADLVFLKAAMSGCALVLARSSLSRLLSSKTQQPSFPLLQQSKKQERKGPLPTRSIKKQLEQASKGGIIFYGTQTGTAERLASRLSKEAATKYGLDFLVADLDDYDYGDLQNLAPTQPVLFLLATYGEGEPTDNAITLNQHLAGLSKKHVDLSNLTYAAFGLGSSSYQSYNAMIRNVDQILLEAGSQRVGSLGLGDDGKGTLDEDFTTWTKSTLAQIAARYGRKELPYRYSPSFDIIETTMQEEPVFCGQPNKAQLYRRLRGPYTAQNPLPARITEAKELYRSDRHCLHVEFDTAGSNVQYETGDHLAVWPVNSDIEVLRFLRIFNLQDPDRTISIMSKDSNDKVPINSPSTYDAAVRYYLDICAPVSRQVLRQLANFADDATAAQSLITLCDDDEIFSRTVSNRRFTMAQTLRMVTGKDVYGSVPFSFIIENIPKLKPRHYSISSSALKCKDKISITAVVDTLTTPSSRDEAFTFNGVCTNFLLALKSQICPDPEVGTHRLDMPQSPTLDPSALIHVRPSKFRLPRKPTTPIIMIGPGTGLAPFRGFIQERVLLSKSREIGQMLLFYGCRDESEFLYRDEWEAHHAVLPEKFKMYTAFSRQLGGRKRYVQDILKDESVLLKRLLREEFAHVYVCGDAKRMAKDVWQCFADILGGDGAECLVEMKKAGRWREDVW